MKIEVLGTGCAKCKKLTELVTETVKESGVVAEISKVDQINDIMNYGVMMTPALAIDGKVVVTGRIPSKDELKKWIGGGEGAILKNIILMLLAVMLISLPGFAKAPAVAPGPQVTFVELGSVNCMPCKMMQQVMKAIEDDYSGSVKVVFHDVSKSEGRPFAEKYGIQAIPTQIFLDNNGKEFFRHTGFYPKEEIVKVLEKQGVKKAAFTAPVQKSKPADGTTCPVGSVCK